MPPELEEAVAPPQPESAVIAPPKPEDEAASAGAAREQAAVRTARAVKHETPVDLAAKPQSPEEYEQIAPGAQWVDPEGKLRTKPWKPESIDDYKNLPEGADWVDPEGNVRSKPVYQDIGFTAQTLYNMATNDKERRNALEYAYPGKVKTEEGTGDIYVDDEGTHRRPRGFGRSPLASLAAGAAPTVGAVGGEILGGIGGSALPGPGTIGGAIAGAAVGGAVGQGFNDLFLKGLGLTDRSAGEEAAGLGLSAAFGAGGTAAGRMLGAGGVATEKIATLDPARIANMVLETDPQALRTAVSLSEKGVQYQPISPWAPGAPHLINIVEVYDRAFHTQQPLRQEATKHYENAGKEILEGLGVKTEGSLAEPEAATPTREVGQKLMEKAREKVLRADADLRAAYEARVAPLKTQQAGAQPAQEARMQALQQAEKQSREAATGFVNSVYQDIQTDIERAIQMSGAGRNSGELWEQVAKKFTAARRAFGQEAEKQYGLWREQYGSIQPGTLSLAEDAENFLAMLPPEFKSRYPSMIQTLAKLGGVKNEEGELIKPPVEMDLSELHGLRSLFRYGIDWRDLRSDVLNGAMKKFEGKVNDLLHDAKPAAQELDRIDKWYRENGDIYSDKRVQSVIDGLRGGEPADPKVLYDVIIKEGRTDLNRKIERMVGPNLWRGIQAADATSLMESTKTEVPGQIDGGAFVRGVLDRYRSGMLESIHGERTSRRWLDQVQNIKMLDGKLPVTIRPGDQITDAIATTRQAADELKTAAKIDPLALLNKEMKTIRTEHAQTATAAQKARRQEPLGFLYDPTMGASEAADRILGSSDLIYASEKMFGRESDEFKMLQQTWARQILEGTMEPSKRLAKSPEDIQRLMMPEITYKQMKLLADEMDQLMSTRGLQETAKSMAAQSKVEHPFSGVLGRGGSFIPKIPGADFVMRAALGGYFGAIRSLAGKQWLLKWLEKGLESNDPAVKAQARSVLRSQFRRATQIMGAAGAGAGEGFYQAGQDNSGLQDQAVGQ